MINFGFTAKTHQNHHHVYCKSRQHSKIELLNTTRRSEGVKYAKSVKGKNQ